MSSPKCGPKFYVSQHVAIFCTHLFTCHIENKHLSQIFADREHVETCICSKTKDRREPERNRSYTDHLKHPWQQEMDRDGNAGVLYERMSRALVLSSPARGNLAERQAVWGLHHTAIDSTYLIVKDQGTSSQNAFHTMNLSSF